MVIAERPASAEREPLPGFTPPPEEEAEDIFARYLPGILSRDPFMANFLRVFDSLLRPLLQQLDAVEYYFDPQLTPLDLLPWLETWIGEETLRSWPEPSRRALVREAAVLHRTRGTHACLKRALQLVTGKEVLVIENSDGLRLDEDGELGINTALNISQPDTIFIVIRRGSDVDLQAVSQVVHRLKPAHAAFSVRLTDE